MSIEQARRIRELEEELIATREKLAQAVLEVDLLKKSRTLRSRAHRVDTSTPSAGSLAPEGACQMIGLSASTYYYQPKRLRDSREREDAELRDAIEAVQADFPKAGYRTRCSATCAAGAASWASAAFARR